MQSKAMKLVGIDSLRPILPGWREVHEAEQAGVD